MLWRSKYQGLGNRTIIADSARAILLNFNLQYNDLPHLTWWWRPVPSRVWWPQCPAGWPPAGCSSVPPAHTPVGPQSSCYTRYSHRTGWPPAGCGSAPPAHSPTEPNSSCYARYSSELIFLLNIFLASGGTLPWDFTVLHNDPAAPLWEMPDSNTGPLPQKSGALPNEP